MEIPISFGAVVETGTAVVQCGNVSETECNCSDNEPEISTSAPKNGEVKEYRFFNR